MVDQEVGYGEMQEAAQGSTGVLPAEKKGRTQPLIAIVYKNEQGNVAVHEEEGGKKGAASFVELVGAENVITAYKVSEKLSLKQQTTYSF